LRIQVLWDVTQCCYISGSQRFKGLWHYHDLDCLILQDSISQPFIARRHLLVLKNIHGSSHPCTRKYGVSGLLVTTIKNLYLRTDFRELQTHTSSMCSNALHDLTLIKLTATHVVDTGGFLIRYSNYHTK